ncbi:MAG: VWA domain-containing protein [Gemmatimonadota bacterium]|nr:VWA domain-containing protein [Gemmatimonadota bacterium]
MRFTTYTKYRKSWLDALNLEKLLEMLSEFLLDGGFAGGPHFHPYWGWSGTEDTSSLEALKRALLGALMESGQLTREMLEELRGEGPGNPEVRKEIADLLDEIIRKMIEEGYITVDGQAGGLGGSIGEAAGEGQVDEARDAARQVDFNLTRRGLDFLGYRALRNLMSSMGKSSIGSHETREFATGVEADAGSRPYEFGDTLNLDLPATLRKTIAREGLQVPPAARGKAAPPMAGGESPGVPLLNLDYKDLMVHQTDYRSSCATVLMLDISHSMILYGEDRFSPAKKVALALSHLVRTEYPGDSLRVVTFGDRAEEIPLAQLARAQVGPFHTNTAEGFQLARRLLKAQKKDMRQIIMITDGKPSAITLPRGRIYKNSAGLDRNILRATYREASACRRAGIPINTFMLADNPYLVRFVRRVTKIARGKAYFTSTMTLGQYIMMDFLKGKGRAA